MGRFRKGGRGGPGRPKGLRNKATIERDVKGRLSSIFESDGYFRMVHRKAVAGRLPGPVWRFYLELVHGKPRQAVDVSGRLTLEELVANSRASV